MMRKSNRKGGTNCPINLMKISFKIVTHTTWLQCLLFFISFSYGANCCFHNLNLSSDDNDYGNWAESNVRMKRDTLDGDNVAGIDNGVIEGNRAWKFISRAEWKAREPKTITNFTGSIPYVILHHSYQPGVCSTEDACKASMRSMQNYHMDSHGWPDIGYSFAIGGDGNVYIGRGYNVVGAHAPNYNSQSIGLLLIGNFQEKLPPRVMLESAKDFIQYSVDIGKLDKNYILYGHRQVRATECPGEALYNEIKTWNHWQEKSSQKKP